MMAAKALIGHTGFVGSTLLRDTPYQSVFNSRNIKEIEGRHFDSVVCAGVSAVKWLANKEPKQDWDAISRLITSLETVRADKFILISTVDVYSKPLGLTEDDLPDVEAAEPYGRHRRQLEEWVEDHFEEVLIVRLPALFGAGLKKNVIFDLLNDNQTEKINPNGSFQWYPMQRFSSDLALLDKSGERLVNVAVEPILTSDIVATYFPDARIGSTDMPPLQYDIRTRNSGLLGGQGPYHISREKVMHALGEFISEQRL